MDYEWMDVAAPIVAAVAAALITTFGRDLWDVLPRTGARYPELEGRWLATWYIDRKGEEQVYIEDVVEVARQRGRSVRGVGRDSRARGDYVLSGRFNSHGVVNLTYEYPRAGMAGSLLLEVPPVPRHCHGRWQGYTEEDEVISGRLEWVKQV